MSTKEDKEYMAYLKQSVVLDEETQIIDVPEYYQSLSNAARNWDGKTPYPSSSDEVDLSGIVNKILKKEPEEEGRVDEERDDGDARFGVKTEYANSMERAKAKIEGDPEDEDGECADCDKKIEEAFRELGISPLSLLEDDDMDEDDDDDEELPDENLAPEVAAVKEVEKDVDDEVADNAVTEGYTKKERTILETLIKQLNEIDEADAVDKEDDDDEDDDDDDDVDVVVD